MSSADTASLKGSKKKKKIAWSLWIPVLIGFLLIIAAWTTVIVIAANNPTQTVELDAP